tara:strand:- start:1778 stop:1987 length:210 start_codon:yes stop_codon:yes gene_type:complete
MADRQERRQQLGELVRGARGRAGGVLVEVLVLLGSELIDEVCEIRRGLDSLVEIAQVDAEQRMGLRFRE